MDDRQAALFAIAAAEGHANPEWMTQFVTALGTVARSQKDFTAVDVLDRQKLLFGEDLAKTHDLRASGGVFRRWAGKGWIVATGEYRNTGTHGRPQRVWRLGE